MGFWTNIFWILIGANLAAFHVNLVDSLPSEQPITYIDSRPLQLLPLLSLVDSNSLKDDHKNSSDYQTILMNRWGDVLETASSSESQVVLFESSLSQILDDLGISTSKCNLVRK